MTTTAGPQTVKVTTERSSYNLRDGLRINLDDTFVHFYNRSLTSMAVPPKVKLQPESISFKNHGSPEVLIDFRRVPRLPDDGNVFEIPPPEFKFPLLLVNSFSRIPDSLKKKGGVFFPMLQREAASIRFYIKPTTYGKIDGEEYAVKIYAGSTNVLTGSIISEPSTKRQDHIVIPTQKYVSGFRVGGDLSRQFTAMPIGEHYTAEYHLTGHEYIGGIQIEIASPIKESATFRRLGPRKSSSNDRTSPTGLQEKESSVELIDTALLGPSPDSVYCAPPVSTANETFSLHSTPRANGIKPGQTIYMESTLSPFELPPVADAFAISKERFLGGIKTESPIQESFEKKHKLGEGPYSRIHRSRKLLRKTHVNELFVEPLDDYSKVKPKTLFYYGRQGQEIQAKEESVESASALQPLLEFHEKSSLMINVVRMQSLTLLLDIDIMMRGPTREVKKSISRVVNMEISPFHTFAMFCGILKHLVEGYAIEEGEGCAYPHSEIVCDSLRINGNSYLNGIWAMVGG